MRALSFLLSLLSTTVWALPHQQPLLPEVKWGYPEECENAVERRIERWALNPSGDAAVITLSTSGDTGDSANSANEHELHLLAINAQFKVPSAFDSLALPGSVYTFISDDTFLTIRPSLSPSSHSSSAQSSSAPSISRTPKGTGSWEIAVRYLNYTTLPPAYLPSASLGEVRGEIKLVGEVTKVRYAAQARVLAISSSTEEGGRVVLYEFERRNGSWTLQHLNSELDGWNMDVIEFTISSTTIAITARDPASGRPSLFTLDLTRPDPKPVQLSSPTANDVSVAALALDGKGSVAWLEGRNGRPKELRLYDGKETLDVPLDWDKNASSVLFSLDGSALYLLAPHDEDAQVQAQALYHIWTPSAADLAGTRYLTPSIPTLIPVIGSIHDAAHVGITPLNHSHLIAAVSNVRHAGGLGSGPRIGSGVGDLWVISHSPGNDAADNYEQVRLTYFTGHEYDK